MAVDYSDLSAAVRTKYNTHSGADITIFMAGVEIGTAVTLSIDVERMKQPLFTFGSPSPRAIGRGIRRISGVLENVSIKNSLINLIMAELKDANQHWIAKKEVEDGSYDFYASYETVEGSPNYQGQLGVSAEWANVQPHFLDELLPVDIVLASVNEMGAMGRLVIKGAEFATSSWAMTVNDVTSVERLQFLARDLEPWKEISWGTSLTPGIVSGGTL